MIELDLNENQKSQENQENQENKEDIRWKQRFQNFKRAFSLLRSAVESKNINEFSDLEQEGIIQRFEYTFELAWKTLKDYLEYSGVNLSEVTPRAAIKECAELNIFSEAEIDPHIFMDMLSSKIALFHVCDFEQYLKNIKAINNKIRKNYLTEFKKEYIFLLSKAKKQNVEGAYRQDGRNYI